MNSNIVSLSKAKDINIKLSDTEKQLLLNNLNEILNNSDPMSASEYIKETVSSFENAFPNYHSENEGLGVLNKSYMDIFKKRFNLDKAIEDKKVNLEEIFKDNGIILGLDIINKKSNLIEEVSDSNRLNDAIKTLDNFIGNNLNETLKKSLNDLDDKHIKIIADKEAMDKLEVLANYGKEAFDIINNSDVQLYTQIGIGALSFISTTLVYRMLIKTYSEVVYKNHNYENLSPKHKQIKLNARSKDIRRFVLFTGPVLVGLLLVISNKFPSKHSLEISTNSNIDLNASASNVESVQKASLISILTNKFKNINWNWLKLLNISIFSLIIIGFSLKYIFHINDTDNIILIQIFSIKNYIYSNIFYIKSFLIIWLLGWNLFYILLYFKYKYYFDKEIKIVSKFLPNIIINEIEELNSHSKEPDLKNYLVKIKFRAVVFYSIITILYICLIFYF